MHNATQTLQVTVVDTEVATKVVTAVVVVVRLLCQASSHHCSSGRVRRLLTLCLAVSARRNVSWRSSTSNGCVVCVAGVLPCAAVCAGAGW